MTYDWLEELVKRIRAPVVTISTEDASTLLRGYREMREALEAIKAGRIDLQFNEKTDRPMWHVAFVQLQSIARAALQSTGGKEQKEETPTASADAGSPPLAPQNLTSP